MLIKHTLTTALITILLIFGAGLGVAKYRHTMTLESWLQYVWLISVAVGYIGFLCRGGAARGHTVEASEAVLRTSHDPGSVNEADIDNASAGIAFGLVVMFASIAVFAGALAALCIYFP